MADNIRADTSTLHRREVSYVGGQYVPDGNGKHTMQGQMYVERLVPETPTREFPIVFIHGSTRSGTDWLTKPDGQPGWASYFLGRGFECYLVDLPFRGRSAWHPGHGRMADCAAEPLCALFSACAKFGTWPQARLHTQWPGPGIPGDPVFDQFYASSLQVRVGDDDDQDAATLVQEAASGDACAALLDRIGRPVILAAHSAGGPVPWLVADARPGGAVRMIIVLEPAGPPFRKIGVAGSGAAAPWGIATAPLTYDPPVADPRVDFARQRVAAPGPGLMDCELQAEGVEEEKGGDVMDVKKTKMTPRQLPNLKHVRVLVVTAQASYHAQYDWATAAYLRQAGVADVEHLRLEDRGFLGNGHMMFLERNSDAVAAEIVRWIEGHGEKEA
ncbi:alpha/beta-hydrolase [Hypoxylon sp. FL1284]|nr:alpha/beta-hydrolase [Hypoxylon sp. FL1284]